MSLGADNVEDNPFSVLLRPQPQLCCPHHQPPRKWECLVPAPHLRTNLEVNLLKMLPEAPRRPWLWPEGEAGVTP